jgi:hypothetical protein
VAELRIARQDEVKTLFDLIHQPLIAVLLGGSLVTL